MFLLYEKYNYTARCLYIEGIYLLFSLFFSSNYTRSPFGDQNQWKGDELSIYIHL